MEGIEVPVAKHDTERSAEATACLMEEVCQCENLRKALKRAKKNIRYVSRTESPRGPTYVNSTGDFRKPRSLDGESYFPHPHPHPHPPAGADSVPWSSTTRMAMLVVTLLPRLSITVRETV